MIVDLKDLWAEWDLTRTAFPIMFGGKPSMGVMSYEEITYFE